MEVQAQASCLSGALLFEVTGAQQKDHPPPWSISLLCQWLPEQPSIEQQQCRVQEMQRPAWSCVSVLLREVCTAPVMLQQQEAQHSGSGHPLQCIQHVAKCRAAGCCGSWLVFWGFLSGRVLLGRCAPSWHWRLAGEIAAQWLAGLR